MKLELRDITKRFGTLVANDRISLTVEPGEIHCLLGENGAGKSTLMNVLYGLYRADEGEIILDGEVQHFAGPGDAIAAGIGMVHQHFMLIPVFTVAENVMLGNEATGFAGSLDIDAARKRVQEISQRFGFHVNPDAIIEDLPVGVQQRVEIIKALSRDAEVLVFDEPTAVLTPQETDELMGIMRQLKEAGKAIVFITHKLREVREVADRITVIRLGKVVGEAEPHRQQRRARGPDGRPPGRADGAQGPAASSARTPWSSTSSGSSTPSATCTSTTSASRSSAARCWPWPASRATARPSSPRRCSASRTTSPARSRSTARSWSAARCARSSTPASASSPRTARSTGWSATSPSPRTSCSTAASTSPSSAAARCSSTSSTSSRSKKLKEYDVRAPGITTHGRQPLRRQPAEGRRRPRALPRPAAARGGPADPRRRRRVHRVHPQADRGHPRQRRPGARGLDRARRGRCARGPDHGALPRPDRRASCPPTPPARSSA